MKIIKDGITAPKGFQANGLWCGIKRSGKPDLALIVSDVPANCAGVFTQGSIKAAPLLVSQKNIKNGQAQAIICNSGNANCFTGKFGMVYAEQTTELIADILKIKKQDVVVSSTGIIGKPLPFEKIKNKAATLVKGMDKGGSKKAAKAIMTTDLRLKECCVRLTLGGKRVTIAGCAKGSGMVAPNMATMLAFITTDAAISKPLLKKALKLANEESFNAITIDGCMSTNDMAIVLANGKAGNTEIKKSDSDFAKFVDALTYLCVDLSKKMVLDGEGATKFIEIQVTGANDFAQAKKVGLAIANSALVKTAVYGSNPNWGRVAAAVGSVGIKDVTEEKLKIDFSDFKKKAVTIHVDLGIGQSEAKVYTSDLTHEYVRINVEYN